MPTSKTRLNITLSPEVEDVLTAIAKRNKSSMSSAAMKLIEEAIELEEDLALAKIIEDRDVPGVKWLTYEEVFGKSGKATKKRK